MASDADNPSPSSILPGRLGGSQVSFEIHTIEANGVVTGRRVRDKPVIISLEDFNRVASIAYFAAGKGDPFANEALLRLEAAMEGTRAALAALAQQVDQAMAGKTRISMGVSRHPRAYTLTIAHYGSQMADLIMDYDKLVITIRNAHFHNRLGTREARRLTEVGRRAVRTSLMRLQTWRFTNVTFADLRQLNPLAREAIEKLVASHFLDLSEHEGDWGKAAAYYATVRAEPRFGPARREPWPDDAIDEPALPTPDASTGGDAGDSTGTDHA